jgi:hypothetical protein
MSFEARCPQCVFVSRQLGQLTPCLLHVTLATEAEAQSPTPSDTVAPVAEAEVYDEPYAFGQLRVSVDRPGPFSLREYVRLQLLRTRIQANPSKLDAAVPRAHAKTILSR